MYRGVFQKKLKQYKTTYTMKHINPLRMLAVVLVAGTAALTLTAQKGKTRPRQVGSDTTKTVVIEKGDTLKILIPPQDSIPVGDAGEGA